MTHQIFLVLCIPQGKLNNEKLSIKIGFSGKIVSEQSSKDSYFYGHYEFDCSVLFSDIIAFPTFTSSLE